MCNKDAEKLFLFNKYDGCCAYCGKELKWHEKDKRQLPKMQIDHIIPLYRGTKKSKERTALLESLANKNPSCPRCNRWKAVWTVEEFRGEIEAQRERIMKVAGVRLAFDFKLIQFTPKRVRFHFEKKDR